jgi:hypothetical protein
MVTLLQEKMSLENSQMCDPCKRGDTETEATSWCKDCGEALCEPCTNYHTRVKILMNHKVITLEEMRKQPPKISDADEFCSILPGEINRTQDSTGNDVSGIRLSAWQAGHLKLSKVFLSPSVNLIIYEDKHGSQNECIHVRHLGFVIDRSHILHVTNLTISRRFNLIVPILTTYP